MRVDPTRRGAALIEALISLVLLGSVGMSVLVLLGQTRAAIHSALLTEQAVDRASAELDRLVLYDRAQLGERVGWMVDHGMAVHLEQSSRTVFDVTVAREPGGASLLATTLYRPDSADAR